MEPRELILKQNVDSATASFTADLKMFLEMSDRVGVSGYLRT